MRDTIPIQPLLNEWVILNLNRIIGEGITRYDIKKEGRLKSILIILAILENHSSWLDIFFFYSKFHYNYKHHQSENSVVCRHLCLMFISQWRF